MSSFAPQVNTYLVSKKRYEEGERSLTIVSPVVGQKSYSKEKRFLCPPPAAYLIGPGWFDPVMTPAELLASMSTNPSSPSVQLSLRPPLIEFSITDEAPASKAAVIQWTTDESDVIPNSTFDFPSTSSGLDKPPLYGFAINKSLVLTEGVSSSVGEKGKRRAIRTCVKVVAPSVSAQGRGVEVGTFEGREIRLVSKPTRKKVAGSGASVGSRTLDLTLNHGTLISLFQRHRSQSSLTRYMSMKDSTSRVTATDGSILVNEEALMRRKRNKKIAPVRFEASGDVWSSFIIWKVNARSHPRLQRSSATLSPDPDWPDAPSNALPYDPIKPKPIRYNNTVMLQCPQSGALSPVLVVRRLGEGVFALGGDSEMPMGDEPGRMAEEEDEKDEEGWCCPANERPGELITQLQKVALEVYSPSYIPLPPGSAGKSGSFLTISDDRIHSDLPFSDRTSIPPETGAEGELKRGGARWSIQLTDSAFWSIVNVDSVKHTFYVPRVSPEQKVGVLGEPVTPLPTLVKYVSDQRAEENQTVALRGYEASFMVGGEEREMIILYGHHFGKIPDSSFSSYELFFGTARSPHVELRCEEVLTAVIPDEYRWEREGRAALSLVRKADGVTMVSKVVYWK